MNNPASQQPNGPDQPDFNECSNLREAAKRVWDWAWDHAEINPLTASPREKSQVYSIATNELTSYALQQTDTPEQIDPEEIVETLFKGFDDWVEESIEITMHRMEQEGKVKRVEGGWTPTTPEEQRNKGKSPEE